MTDKDNIYIPEAVVNMIGKLTIQVEFLTKQLEAMKKAEVKQVKEDHEN